MNRVQFQYQYTAIPASYQFSVVHCNTRRHKSPCCQSAKPIHCNANKDSNTVQYKYSVTPVHCNTNTVQYQHNINSLQCIAIPEDTNHHVLPNQYTAIQIQIKYIYTGIQIQCNTNAVQCQFISVYTLHCYTSTVQCSTVYCNISLIIRRHKSPCCQSAKVIHCNTNAV